MSDDFDPGDDCLTENHRHFHPMVWHESMKPASVPVLPVGQTEAGRRALAALRAQVLTDRPAPRREPVATPSWRDMPELYRRMVVAAAGVGKEVVDKIDRDLTEREKAMMRSAIGDMREWLGTVAAL